MRIVVSLLITIIISLLVGFGVQNLLGFWQGASIAFVMQIIIAFVYNSFKAGNIEEIRAEYENDIEDILKLSEVDINCPCGNYTFTERVYPNIDSEYTCPKCNNSFKINVSIIPTLTTEVVDISQTFDDLVSKAREAAKVELERDNNIQKTLTEKEQS